ncbi:MAG TPA: lipopolysaccharide ABC transporter ATP-binding protein, partial [Chitinophagaceae bacterium]|nr:lipopolysaccharide ABC transporter ATP-binding protein [Chitinophagaceae bacterium]
MYFFYERQYKNLLIYRNMLVARGIKKAYEQVSVLRGVDIEVQKSEIVSIAG